MAFWLWQSPHWPQFSWQQAEVLPRLRRLQQKSGLLLGKSAGSDEQQHSLDALLSNLITSSAIEGERLNVHSVRSSLARKFGLDDEHPYPTSKRSDGLADILRDALSDHQQPLSMERLFQWHRWLFAEGDSGFTQRPLLIGQLRGEEPMQVVSGTHNKPKVHFEAPPRAGLEQQLQQFIDWFNHSADDVETDPWLRAAITHLWFITLHPFDDGNGRLVRALTDMALAQADSQSVRLYAMSASILEKRASYYDILEQTQHLQTRFTDEDDEFDAAFNAVAEQFASPVEESDQIPDITPWLAWFLDTLEAALDSAIANIDRTLFKTRFWQRFNQAQLSAEQKKVLNRLLDGGEKGFSEGISASQYQKVAKVSKATATRHLQDLMAQGCIEKLPGGGRSTRYQLAALPGFSLS